MRVASSGTHNFVAVGGASALGSVASCGWIAPQAANNRAKAAGEVPSRPVRVHFDGRGGMDPTAPYPDERRPHRAREARRSYTGGLTRRSAHSYSPAKRVRAMDGDRHGRQGWSCDSARAPSQSLRQEPSRPAVRVPLAWRILTYDKRRTGLALIGIFMAILLVFVELGFFYAVPRGGLLLYDNMKFDLLLASTEYE